MHWIIQFQFCRVRMCMNCMSILVMLVCYKASACFMCIFFLFIHILSILDIAATASCFLQMTYSVSLNNNPSSFTKQRSAAQYLLLCNTLLDTRSLIGQLNDVWSKYLNYLLTWMTEMNSRYFICRAKREK